MQWLDARDSDTLMIRHRVVNSVHKERSAYQEIEVIDTVDFGRMLLLDGIIQTSVRDEFIYHEMLAHVPLFVHPNPKRVLIIGGGDGGTLRETLKHPSVEEVHLVEIDERVIDASRKYLPELSGGFDDPRAKVVIRDGIEYVAEVKGAYDVILIDAPDPEGAAVGLFSTDFYANARDALGDDGVLAAQTESPFIDPKLVKEIYDRIWAQFPLCRLYTAHVPSYSVGIWSFALALKRPEMFERYRRAGGEFKTRYYNSEIHAAAFALPEYILELLGDKARA
ncbi:MAG: polyamine aminopropyltransferase [Firmicutes bacterium]|nr:polyamine aminopropyltransferase [Bacillota bacterium]